MKMSQKARKPSYLLGELSLLARYRFSKSVTKFVTSVERLAILVHNHIERNTCVSSFRSRPLRTLCFHYGNYIEFLQKVEENHEAEVLGFGLSEPVYNQNGKVSIGVVSDEVHVQSGTSIKKDETEIMSIEIEDFADTQEEEDRIAKHPLIKCEHKDSINLQKVVPDSYGETSFEASYDDNQVIDIKVEDDGGVKKEEDPVLISYDDNQVIDIKVEDVGGVKEEEEDPVSISYDDNQVIDIKVVNVRGVKEEEEDPVSISYDDNQVIDI